MTGSAANDARMHETPDRRSLSFGPAPCSALTAKDIMPGRCYEAKRPARIGYPSLYNDRQVKWVSSLRTEVQYDSPTVADGRHYPKVSMEKFLKWAGRDVTAIMPRGEWRAWRE